MFLIVNGWDRMIFREFLIKSILASGPVRGLGNDERMRFLDQLSQSWTVAPSEFDSDSTRIRGFK